MHIFKNKNVAILGLSVEGLDSVKFFQSEGAHIWCCDRRTREALGATYTNLENIAEGFQLGDSYLNDLERFDYIVRTPGMNPRLPELKGKAVTSSTTLFFDLCRAPIIGVTGTKGKGTTSTLISEMLKAGGKHAWLGGNVGVPLLSKVHHIKPTDWVVLELSSFQLEDLTKSPHIAVVLRTTQEHLMNQDKLATNFHPTREAYVEAKKSIVKYQISEDFAILDADDPTSRSFAHETPAKIFYYSRNKPYMSLAEITLRGKHNLDNVSAAALAATVAGVPDKTIRGAAAVFKGLEHRLEEAGVKDGVLYVNDSFSTTPETAIAAFESFDEPVILIAGGSEKGSDFTELGQIIAKKRPKAIIAIGAMAGRIIAAAKNAGYAGNIICGLTNMHDIVRAGARLAKPDDVVLLSPACASFDMFANYKERGKQFKYEVSLL